MTVKSLLVKYTQLHNNLTSDTSAESVDARKRYTPDQLKVMRNALKVIVRDLSLVV